MADPIKWFSAALKAAQELPQNFGTAEQMLKLLNKYGAKQSELNYLKVPTFAAQFEKRVPKQALVDYIDANKVLPTEVVKTSDSFNSRLSKLADDKDFWKRSIAGRGWAGVTGRAPNFNELSIDQRGELLADISNQGYSNVPWLDDLVHEADTKYSEYATYPNSGYKETLLTLPQNKPQISSLPDYLKVIERKYASEPAARFGVFGSNGNASAYGATPEEATANAIKYINSFPAEPLYQSSHWDEPNVLLHLRTSEAPTHAEYAGPSTLPFLEELQSDWGQAGRKSGFKMSQEEYAAKRQAAQAAKNEAFSRWQEAATEKDKGSAELDFQNAHRELERWSSGGLGAVNPAPLVTNTNDWASAGVRRFLAEAAAQDAPQIAWTIGAQQSARYQGHAPEGMSGFYDRMLPNIINKYIKPYGGQVNLATPLQEVGTLPSKYRSSIAQPHTATLPPALRAKLRDEGIPFFRHGGTVNKYAGAPVYG